MPQNTTFGEALRRKVTPTAITVAAVCALGLAVSTWFAVVNKEGWGLDYNQFYSASRLVGTGHAYDWEALRKIEAENGPAVHTGRLPVVLYAHKALGSLPYATARSIWLAASMAALAIFAAFWPGTRGWRMMVGLAWSMPATLLLLYGQDVPFWLMFFSGGLWFMERKKPWSAGVVFALCICKFHLALGLVVMLAAQKRWKTLIAGAMAGAALIASCFPIEGPGWPAQYAGVFAKMRDFSPAPERMPNLRGIASWLPWATAVEIVSAVAIMWLLWAVCRSGTDLGTAGAAAAACGLLLGHHGYAGDCLLLMPLSVLTIQRPGMPSWLAVWAAIMLSPAPTLLLVSDRPFLGQMLVVAFTVTATFFARVKPVPQTVNRPGTSLDIIERDIAAGR